jgi:hypothetical protein
MLQPYKLQWEGDDLQMPYSTVLTTFSKYEVTRKCRKHRILSKNNSLQEYDTVKFGRWVQTFWRNLLPPSSTLMMKAANLSETLVPIWEHCVIILILPWEPQISTSILCVCVKPTQWNRVLLEAENHVLLQEFLHCFWNATIHNSLPLVPILSQMDLVHILT